MKKRIKIIARWINIFGINPKKFINSCRGVPSYLRDWKLLNAQKGNNNLFPFTNPYPCLDEKFSDSGTANGHYFHQDLIVARRIFQNQPTRHVDVASRIDGFVAHVASFREIEVVDVRPLSVKIPNVIFSVGDMMKPIPMSLTNYCDSLSCLHALEHFGLGRYGDPIQLNGHLLGLDNFWLMLKKEGRLYLSVPIGPQRIEFNAHRVFSIGYLCDYFEGKYIIERFSYVDDNGDLHEDMQISESEKYNSYGCTFGCGIFELIKL